MSDVLIKGAKMPNNCIVCPCLDKDLQICEVLKRDMDIFEDKLPDCPLVEIPPHGRLIDADKLVRHMEERQEQLNDDEALWEVSVVDTFLSDAPTVIESEGQENE